jgi:hypothetical protein
MRSSELAYQSGFGPQFAELSAEPARWARLGSNQRPLACEASALPLSYAPGRGLM